MIFIYLPNDIHNIIIEQLTSFRDLFSISILNKEFISKYYRRYIVYIGNLNFITQDYPEYICNIFKTKYDLAELPIYYYTRYSEYKYNTNIEQIYCEDMEHSIMRGNDKYGRKYICFKLNFKYIDSNNQQFSKGDYSAVITLHEVYCGLYSPHGAWAFSSNYDITKYIYRGCLPTNQIINQYQKLAQGKSIQTDKYNIRLYN